VCVGVGEGVWVCEGVCVCVTLHCESKSQIWVTVAGKTGVTCMYRLLD